jgi:hypothetical protein
MIRGTQRIQVRWSCFLSVAFLLLVSSAVSAAQTFSDVKARFAKSNEREMDEKGADLTLDAAARRLRVKSGDRPLDVAYDDVQKVVVEVDTLGRKSGFGASFLGMFAGGLLFGNAIATSIDKPFDNDHFIYLAYKKADGSYADYGLVIGKESVPQALKALQQAFGEKVEVPAFAEKVEELDKKQFPSDKSRVRHISTDKKHPLPEVRPDAALVVVVTPSTIMRRFAEKNYGIARAYANNKLVAVSSPGAYLYFYLEPGEYLLASETFDVTGLRMKLEAGKDYYLTQTLYAKGIRLRSFLTRHSKELVMYEVSGSLFSDWGPEEAKK